MLCYRWHVGLQAGWTQSALITALIKSGITDATIYKTVGLWNGETEESVVVEVLTPFKIDGKMIAKSLAAAMEQVTVIVTEQPITVERS